MDDISHGALGAACAHILLGKKNNQIPWQAGAIAAIAPDIDVFFRLFSQDPMSGELWHRNFTHSLIFIPLGGLLVALALICFAHFRAHWRLTIAASLIGYSTHALLDACTSYGTLLFWPWSDARVSWDVISIIDPVFTLPLVLGTLWSVLNHERKFAMMSVLFAACFLVFNTFQHQRALDALAVYAKQQKYNLSKVRALPALTSSTRWRMIGEQNTCFFIGEAITSLWKASYINPIDQVLAFSKNTIPFKLSAGQTKDLATFSWFASNYLIIANHKPLTLADGRYTMGKNPIYSLWGVQFIPGQKHVNKIGAIPLNERCKIPQN